MSYCSITFRISKIGRLRLNILVLGLIIGIAPFSIIYILLPLILPDVNIRPFFDNEWVAIALVIIELLIPLVFAYAIIRHKVIPVSFVIRRGLQYLFAQNALRLLLILPILGIIWNVAANPSRPLDEILLKNSAGFYVLIGFAAVLLLFNRFGLREWIDRKFFREQYNQERILRESVEAVKESDSLVKLSRMVSSQIQAALHPENIYLFFRDDEHQSDFSLGYTTEETSEKSSNLKLNADSPLLRFMQEIEVQ